MDNFRANSLKRVAMKQMYSDQKYVIAWFKIAEYVNRGEKERALGVYRLLSHSIDDKSLVLQLEADILFACNDDKCFELYHKAALHYLKNEKHGQAAALFEQMLLVKADLSIRTQLFHLYITLEKKDAAYLHLKTLIKEYHNQGSLLLAYEVSVNAVTLFTEEQQWELYHLFLLKENNSDSLANKIKEWALIALCDIAIKKGDETLDQFLIDIHSSFPQFLSIIQKRIDASW